MKELQLTFHIIFLFFILVAFFYNWLYFLESGKSKNHMGVSIPKPINKLLKTGIIICLIFAIIIMIFIVSNVV